MYPVFHYALVLRLVTSTLSDLLAEYRCAASRAREPNSNINFWTLATEKKEALPSQEREVSPLRLHQQPKTLLRLLVANERHREKIAAILPSGNGPSSGDIISADARRTRPKFRKFPQI